MKRTLVSTCCASQSSCSQAAAERGCPDSGAPPQTRPNRGGRRGNGATDGSATKEDDATPRKGTVVKLADSDFGRMLFDSQKQAIYIFERDASNKSNCYGECAEAWPPVFTKGEPQAGEGSTTSLLGTTKRRDGKLQVTYAGKPLYYYAHEDPGEVKLPQREPERRLLVGRRGRRRAAGVRLAVLTIARRGRGWRCSAAAGDGGGNHDHGPWLGVRQMLFGPNRQAIYVFERDRRKSRAATASAREAWPPVYTKGKPAGAAAPRRRCWAHQRRDGRLQVTYAGKPLYYYAHEGPGEVECHNVNLNGGLWWVLGPTASVALRAYPNRARTPGSALGRTRSTV